MRGVAARREDKDKTPKNFIAAAYLTCPKRSIKFYVACRAKEELLAERLLFVSGSDCDGAETSRTRDRLKRDETAKFVP